MNTLIEYCPSGFITPFKPDWRRYINAASNVTNGEGKDEMRQDPFLRLTAARYRLKDNGNVHADPSAIDQIPEQGVYWADGAGVKSYYMYFYRANPTPTPPSTPISPLVKSQTTLSDTLENSFGLSIRCMKQ